MPVMHTELVLGLATSVAASVFLCAGLGKLAVPGHAARAVDELLRLGPRRVAVLVPVVGTVETVTGLALVMPAARPVGVPLAGALGVGFVLLGLFARLRRVKASCGCFGGTGGRPFGLRNSLSGLALLAVAVADAAVPYPPHLAYPALPLALTAGASACLAGWMQRGLIVPLLGPRAKSSTPQGVGA
jgi:hypothetical protein